MQRRARRSDGGRAFQPVLSHARTLLELTGSTQKELRGLRSVREAGALLEAAATAATGSAAALAKASVLGEHWRARALSTSNLQRLHSVVAELSGVLGRAVPPPPPPRLAAGEGGETSEDEDAEAWALAPLRPACAKRRRAGDPCSDKPFREVRQQQQAPAAALKKRRRVEAAAAAQQLDTENNGNDAPPPSSAAAASSTKSPVDPSKLSVSVLQDRLRSELGQQAKLPRKKDELVRLYQQQRQQRREEAVDLTSGGDEDLAERQRQQQRQQQQARAAPQPQQCSVASPSRALPPARPPFSRLLRLRQTRGPPLLSPVFSLAHCPLRVSIGRQHLSLELLSGPAGQRPELAPGFDGMLRYGGGHEVRVGRAPCTPGPEGNNMQLRGSPKVSRRACSIAWDEASSRFRVTSLGSVGLTVDGSHCKEGTYTPVGDRSTIAFFGNPAWPVGHRPIGAVPADAYVLRHAQNALARSSRPRDRAPLQRPTRLLGAALWAREESPREEERAPAAWLPTRAPLHGLLKVRALSLLPP